MIKPKQYKRTLLALLLSVASGFSTLQAKVQLPAFIGDNMVLQQKEKVKIWGTSTAVGKELSVNSSWNNKNYQVEVDQQGGWQVYLETPKYGGPYQITINDGDQLILKNILIGEVWFCSGQSNMEMPLAGWGKINNFEQEIKAANFPNIRILQIPKATANQPTTAVKVESGGWNPVTPQSIPEFSATAYFFAREIYEKTGIPIGLIHSSWGGTIIEAWMSREALSPFSTYTAAIEKIQRPDAQEIYAKDLAEWNRVAEQQDQVKTATQGEWFAPQLDKSSWSTITIPSFFDKNLFPGMDGVVYFGKDVELPAHWQGKPLKLILGAIDDNDITYVNGTKVGETVGYDQIRKYTVPAAANNGSLLHIAVRVFDGAGDGGIYGGTEQPRLEGPNGEQLSLVGDWKCKVGYDLAKLPAKPNAMEGPNRPTVLYNAMVKPFVDFKIKGAIWYQGESNADSKDAPYQQLLPALIQDWRQQWNNEKMPFYFVQLANFKAKSVTPQPSSWARLREAQRQTLKLPYTGMAVITDIGDAQDIHPKNKQDVGRRLGWIATAQLYGKKIPYSGPVLEHWTTKAAEMELSFNLMGKKLVLKGADNRNGSFTIAGADQVFYPAEVKQIGNKLIVSAKEVPSPVAVRYGWADNPDLTLYNEAGIPGSPFRTDDWTKN
ncbi:sialate O-acetylesterase [Sphingobacterium siyangense]|uniref:sialate O-acetylesterase n=1 Tax=Sphingobacterium siyangense TaxID=459529 RepID=UPI00200E8A1B|nr:sialate O-acetylesterase [Sphingobacterium siyangense]UQA74396.1 sialate O-acetylesterase [Sphingobacterium siyangense]